MGRVTSSDHATGDQPHWTLQNRRSIASICAVDVIEAVASRVPPPLTPEERARSLSGIRGLKSAEKKGRTQVRDTVRTETKSEWIQKCVTEGLEERYPAENEDAADENAVGTGVAVTRDWLASQIDRAYALAKVEPTVPPGIIASSLLTSHDAELCSDLGNIPPGQLSVNRILAHLLWLHLPIPPRVAGSIARRMYVASINRDASAHAESSGTHYCPDCDQTVAEGDICGCDR